MFQGYSRETFEFFMAIRFNNNREFFTENRDWYLRAVREPSYALAEALAPTLRDFAPDLDYRPYRVVSRINRDIRFSNDKSPYRDCLWLSFKPAGEEGKTMPGFYVDVRDEGVSYGMGFYRGNPEIMSALRRRMAASPEQIIGLLNDLTQDGYELYCVPVRRMKLPDGVPEALRGLYCAKGFYLEKSIDDFAVIQSPSLAEEIGMGYGRLAPLYRYILDAGKESASES